jgi:hypothetical protein
MREWNLKAENLRSLILAADARLSTPDYCNDQVWELSLGGGEPAALALQTTYGLRARSMRLLPRFVEGDETRSDPASFAEEPVLRAFYPNYALVSCSPFPEIEVLAEFWVPQSDTVVGRLRVTNTGSQPRLLQVEWAALLTPLEGGQRMAPQELEAAPLLSGSSGDLAPVVFITGGAHATLRPYPALILGFDLEPGRSRQVLWSQAACATVEESFTQARQAVTANFDAERARIELLNAGQAEIYTGDPDWDLAFALAQKTALGLFVGPSEHLPRASFVVARRPDHGYSLRGDGSDYGHLWNGQTCLDAYTLAGLILPGEAQLAQGLLENFLATQAETGEVDWKPGLGGQRGRHLAIPLLASLAWRIYQADGDRDALAAAFPNLVEFLHAWFKPEHDRDGDGIPEWDHPIQAGFDDHPLFSRWHLWSQNVDISTAESPQLCSFLYRECQSLLQIGELLDPGRPLPEIQALAENLRMAVESAWDTRTSSYHYWDRDVHSIPRPARIARSRGNGLILIGRDFAQPARLVLRVRSSSEKTRRCQAFVHGTNASGYHRVERIPSDRFRWFLGLGSATSDQAYTAVEHIEIQGLDETDRLSVHTAGFTLQDHTLLLPLWAGIPSPKRARTLVSQTIANPKRYWQPFGLPACPRLIPGADAGACRSVYLPWVALIGEGLVAYGYRTEAAELVSRVMAAAVQNLKREGSFRRYYHAETGQGLGERDALGGLPPAGLFLETLGVRLISPHRVALAGFNPFPWPVTVKYRGLTVLCQKDKTQVVFPDGQTVTVDDPEPRIVSLE